MKPPIIDLDLIKREGEIGIKEAARRRKERPNDPQLRKFDRDAKNFFAKISSQYNSILNDFYEMPVQSFLALKQLSKSKSILRVTTIEGVDLLRKIEGVGGKYKTPKKIARLFMHSLIVSKFDVIKCIQPMVIGRNNKSRRLTMKDYLGNKDRYDGKIENSFKLLRGLAKSNGYRFKFSGENIELVIQHF